MSIIQRIKDFLDDKPVASDASGMFIERDDLQTIIREIEFRPTNVVFATKEELTFSSGLEPLIEAGEKVRLSSEVLLPHNEETKRSYRLACAAEEKRVKREPVSEFQSYPEHDEILRAMGIEPENPY